MLFFFFRKTETKWKKFYFFCLLQIGKFSLLIFLSEKFLFQYYEKYFLLKSYQFENETVLLLFFKKLRHQLKYFVDEKLTKLEKKNFVIKKGKKSCDWIFTTV